MPDTDVTIAGRDVKIGTVLSVWWRPGKDRVSKLVPHPTYRDARIAHFDISPTPMTIFDDAALDVPAEDA